jgi:uncharacterized membrane-anchored protein
VASGDVTAGRLRRPRAAAAASAAAAKVPQITAYFWIIKVLTTAQGEATADYLDHRIAPVLAAAIAGLALVASLALQFWVRRYVAWIYWLAVVMVAVFGTMVADGLHVELGIPYAASTTFFAVALAVIFVAWYKTEKTLSIHSIFTPRREAFYWATVMATFALGTAAGDMTATTLHLGYLDSGILFAVVIAVPAVAHRWLGLNAVVAFWFAYIITRPLGASFADWMGVPHSLGGLGWGRARVSLLLTIVIIGFVAYMQATGKDTPDRSPRHARGAGSGPRS